MCRKLVFRTFADVVVIMLHKTETQVRDTFKDYFCSHIEVPWQYCDIFCKKVLYVLYHTCNCPQMSLSFAGFIVLCQSLLPFVKLCMRDECGS